MVAIDLYSWGMRRTPAGPLKIVMDATDLKFLDNSFETVTSFFTLMYMSPEQQEKAAREAYRVLKPGGVFRIWDVELPVSPTQAGFGYFQIHISPSVGDCRNWVRNLFPKNSITNGPL